MKDQTYFCKHWLEDPDFKNQLVSFTNNIQAKCKLCQKTLGETSTIKSCKWKKKKKKKKLHYSRLQKFFKPATVKQTSTSVDSSQSCSTQSTSSQSSNDKETMAKQSTLDLVVRNSEIAKAEIIWVLRCVACGYSSNSCRDLQKIFSTMFIQSGKFHKKIKLLFSKIYVFISQVNHKNKRVLHLLEYCTGAERAGTELASKVDRKIYQKSRMRNATSFLVGKNFVSII